MSVAIKDLFAGAGSINIRLTQPCPGPPGFVVALIKMGSSGSVVRKRDLI